MTMTNLEDQQRVMFMDIPTNNKSRSVSPMSSSPPRDRSMGFFDILTRRFGRRSHDDICYQHHGEEDSRSSSTDSCSSSSGGAHNHHNSDSASRNYTSNLEISCSSDSSSSSNSTEEANNASESRIHRRSTSSLRRALQHFSISSRSLSCSSTLNQARTDAAGTPVKQKKTKKTPAPKRILRQPVSYAYLKGMSGLPTQRVPRSSVCCHYANR